MVQPLTPFVVFAPSSCLLALAPSSVVVPMRAAVDRCVAMTCPCSPNLEAKAGRYISFMDSCTALIHVRSGFRKECVCVCLSVCVRACLFSLSVGAVRAHNAM